MSPEVTAAIIAGSVSVFTLIVTRLRSISAAAQPAGTPRTYSTSSSRSSVNSWPEASRSSVNSWTRRWMRKAISWTEPSRSSAPGP